MAFILDENLLSQLKAAWNGGDKPLDTLASLLQSIGDGVRDREFPHTFVNTSYGSQLRDMNITLFYWICS